MVYSSILMSVVDEEYKTRMTIPVTPIRKISKNEIMMTHLYFYLTNYLEFPSYSA